jgi:parallel beta-helix repeat protein
MAIASTLAGSACFGAVAIPKEIAVYVSLQGNDSWSGANPDSSGPPGTGPLATIRRAKLKVRDILRSKPKMPVTVYVRGGTYYFQQPLEFLDIDSATAASPVTFRSYPNETVVLSGGKQITGFVPYKGQILEAEVSSQGLGGNYFRHLFFGGNRQTLARYPNFDPKNPVTGGWAKVAGTSVDINTVIPNESKTQFVARPGDLRHWLHPDNGEVFIFSHYNWWNDILPIASADPHSGVITLKRPASFGIRPGDRYYIRNLLEELDSPGEWYLDKAANILYFWPPASLASHAVEAPSIQTIFRLDPGVSYVTLRGFTIEMTEGSAIVLAHTSHCLIAGNTIRHVGDYSHNAVEVSGTANGVVGNDIYDVAASAVHLAGGDVPTLAAGGNYADNNYIHHTGVDNKRGVGIFIEGVGNRASHNLIHDTPRFGILFLGNYHLMEFNHIRDTCLETNDAGAIYTHGQDWIGPRGSMIRGNYIHDTFGLDFSTGAPVTPCFSWGIYLDDYSVGVTVDGNIVAGSYEAGIHLHNGCFNHIENNILADSRKAQVSYDGTKNYKPDWIRMLPLFINAYNSLAQAPAWNTVPGARLDPRDAGLPDGSIMQGNKFDHNILYNRDPEALLYHCTSCDIARNYFDYNLIYNFGRPIRADGEGATFSDWQTRTGMDKNSLVANPLFIDADHGDYDLQRNSPASRLGIKPATMRSIGPYRDPLRASWPIVEAAGAREFGNH